MNPGLDFDDVTAMVRARQAEEEAELGGGYKIKADAETETKPKKPTQAEIEAAQIRSYFDEDRINMREAMKTKPAALDFVLPGFVAKTVGCLAAAGSTGKSFLASEIALCIASALANARLLNLDIEKQGKVVVYNAEDTKEVLLNRLFDICSEFDQDTQAEVAQNFEIRALTGRGCNIMHDGWLNAILQDAQGARLLIFDTFSRWHSMSENDNGEMAQVVGRYERIARETGAAVLFLHHVNKTSALNGKQDEQQATRGAASITDNARWQGFMQVMTDKEAMKFGIANSDRKQFVKWGGNKENYGQSSGDKWLERKAGGVLLPVDLVVPAPEPEPKPTTNTGANYEDL